MIYTEPRLRILIGGLKNQIVMKPRLVRISPVSNHAGTVSMHCAVMHLFSAQIPPGAQQSRRLCLAVIDAQNTLSSSVLEKCPGRPELEELITKLMDYPRNHIPFKRGGMMISPCLRRIVCLESIDTAVTVVMKHRAWPCHSVTNHAAEQ